MPLIINILYLVCLFLPAAARADSHLPACGTANASHPFNQELSSLQTMERAAECLSASPTRFSRRGDKVQEGAVYSPEGRVLCILRRLPDAKDDPGAFIYEPRPELEKERAAETSVTGLSTPGDALCDRMAKAGTKLAVSNGDLMNRLHWSIAEGNCSRVLPGRTRKEKDGSLKVVDRATPPDPAHPTGAYLHGFVLANLAKLHPSERQMLQRECNSGPGKDFYRSYFIDGSASHAAPSFRLVTNPYLWKSAPFEEAFAGNDLDKKMSHCLKDLFPSVMPETEDAAAGKAHWHHDPKGCSANALTMRISLGKGYESYCCFTK